jgi:DNA-binding transcriptional MerR regulator
MAKSRDAFRTISEVAEWLDTPAHVLRFWESKFTQVKPVKRAGGRRYYRPADMELLGGIKKLLHDDGMTIKGVQKVLREQGVRHVSSLSVAATEEEAAASNGPLIEDAPFTEVTAPRGPSEVVAFPGRSTERPRETAVTPEAIAAAEPAPEQPEAAEPTPQMPAPAPVPDSPEAATAPTLAKSDLPEPAPSQFATADPESPKPEPSTAPTEPAPQMPEPDGAPAEAAQQGTEPVSAEAAPQRTETPSADPAPEGTTPAAPASEGPEGAPEVEPAVAASAEGDEDKAPAAPEAAPMEEAEPTAAEAATLSTLPLGPLPQTAPQTAPSAADPAPQQGASHATAALHGRPVDLPDFTAETAPRHAGLLSRLALLRSLTAAQADALAEPVAALRRLRARLG